MFPCGWCGTDIDSYAAHFVATDGRDCRTAANTPAPKLVLLDGGASHVRDDSPQARAARAKLRGRTRRDLYRSRNTDRGEQLMLNTKRDR